MRILITGICGFVGSTLAYGFRARTEASALSIVGIDNLSRPGSELNREALKSIGAKLIHGDIRLPSDLETIGDVDWVIDAAANPSVLAGVDGRTSSRQLVEHNLQGTVNMLEFCKARKAGLILLSTSRVYSVSALAGLRMRVAGNAFLPALPPDRPEGLSEQGINEAFSTAPPVSLYGATKLASEQLALEYALAFGFPVWVNRCGVLAGAGQFGRADQGIYSFWLHSWLRRRPLKYIGFGGHGHQVRDCLHPRDLLPLLEKQMANDGAVASPVSCIGGGVDNAMSLAQLSAWCEQRFGKRVVTADPVDRPFDIPWLVMDSAQARSRWQWRVQTPIAQVLEEIALHAETHPRWLECSS